MSDYEFIEHVEEKKTPAQFLLVRLSPNGYSEVVSQIFNDKNVLGNYLRNNLIYRYKIFKFMDNQINEVTKEFV